MTKYTSYEDLPLTLRATEVAQLLGISRANAYQLMHSDGFPTLKIGKRLLVPKSGLQRWVNEHTRTM